MFCMISEQRYFVEEHSFTNETVSSGSSVAFSDIAATTEVSTLLKAFGLDVQRHIKVYTVVKCNEEIIFGTNINKQKLYFVLTAQNTWPIIFIFYSITCKMFFYLVQMMFVQSSRTISH